ncbi:hypothetical protein KJ673_02340 [Patescibacteria group bacterium]|nr:hypothetical protein [Patescibacteria group bacterium]
MEESALHLRLTLREPWINRYATVIRVDGISGRRVLQMLRDMSLLSHCAKSSFWAFNPGRDARLHPYAHCGPVHIKQKECKIMYYSEGPRVLRMNNFMPAHVIRTSGSDGDGIAIAVRDRETWIVVELEPTALLMALTRCNFLRPFDYWCGKWRVRLPDDISL